MTRFIGGIPTPCFIPKATISVTNNNFLSAYNTLSKAKNSVFAKAIYFVQNKKEKFLNFLIDFMGRSDIIVNT